MKPPALSDKDAHVALEVADAEWENTKRFPQAKAVLKQFML